jgi:hypothetical protein
MERMGGAKILVKDTPSVLFMPEELYLGGRPSNGQDSDHAKRFYHAFTQALFRERKEIFRRSCEDGERFETYICKNCLEDHIKKTMASEQTHRRDLVVRFFAHVASTVRSRPDQHRTWIMRRCPWFDYMIQGDDREDPKVFFFGKKNHDYKTTGEQNNLQGFTSDSAAMIDLFRKETSLCRKAVDPILAEDYPDRLIDYFASLFHPYNLHDRFEALLQNA